MHYYFFNPKISFRYYIIFFLYIDSKRNYNVHECDTFVLALFLIYLYFFYHKKKKKNDIIFPAK